MQLESAVGAARAKRLKDRPAARSSWRPNVVGPSNLDEVVLCKERNTDSRLMTSSAATQGLTEKNYIYIISTMGAAIYTHIPKYGVPHLGTGRMWHLQANYMKIYCSP